MSTATNNIPSNQGPIDQESDGYAQAHKAFIEYYSNPNREPLPPEPNYIADHETFCICGDKIKIGDERTPLGYHPECYEAFINSRQKTVRTQT